ncbi:MAG: hypothetical protein A2X49_02090 [Lentisphaerae bacterium GWF2_52_8]|nr:MAG: hypothetical protein A2X49_02090 [Lentisphaerae bacterium GWF2_52_8]
MPITVHLIFNAHLDPVWIWPWQAGLDETLATCRSVCDRLDAHPEIFFSRGEAWVYKQIEALDPALFARICKHVEAGHWEIVGGWWIQPDCNLPNAFAFEKQIGLGMEYFRQKFGLLPRVGYNVDSFGHSAALPRLMHAAGQKYYVMMRPQEHEMSLPSRLFRWRGREGDPEILTFRIPWSYCHRCIDAAAVERVCTLLPEGIGHTMLFAGLGDHGGGPSEKLIEHCKDNLDSFPGCHLEFSTMSRFFEAVSKQADKIPLVTGELQMHAIGCYSVHRPIKTGLRRAEHLLAQAESSTGDMTPENRQVLDKAWEHVCFNQFHDTLGGTCIPSAYRQCENQVAGAAACADEVLHWELRKRYLSLGSDPLQRIVVMNASDSPYDGFVEHEPWLDDCPDNFTLLDEAGNILPWQRMPHEAAFVRSPRVLFRVKAAPGEILQFKLGPKSEIDAQPNSLTVINGAIANSEGVHFDGHKIFFGAANLGIEPLLDLYEDGSDTWSHGMDHYPEGPIVASASWTNPCIVDAGPLMASSILEGRIGESGLKAEWRVYAGEPFCEFILRVHWMERRKLLKLRIQNPRPALSSRLDGTMDTFISRLNNGRELPLRDWTLIEMHEGLKLGILAPDVFALDANTMRSRLTLLRSPVMAHHDPHHGHFPREVFSDQGVHEFRFRFFLSYKVSQETLDLHAKMMQRPLVVGDLTKGMLAQRP